MRERYARQVALAVLFDMQRKDKTFEQNVSSKRKFNVRWGKEVIHAQSNGDIETCNCFCRPC